MASMMVVVLSLITFCMQTIPYFNKYRKIFECFEFFYCAVFTLELLIRVSCCPSFKILFTDPLTYVDIISTLQFYIGFLSSSKSLDILFITRLIRIFRLFRFFKRLTGMQVIAQTLKASIKELMLMSLLMIIPVIIFSTVIYYAEKVVFLILSEYIIV